MHGNNISEISGTLFVLIFQKFLSTSYELGCRLKLYSRTLMKNTFKILLLSLFITTAYGQFELESKIIETSDKAKERTVVHSLESKEFTDENHLTLSENFNSIRCGFLEVKSPFRTDKIVRATKDGCFRWVFSKNGKVTSVSEMINVKQGETKRGFSKNGENIEINCHCRSVKPNY